jgi:serine protease
MSRFRNPALGVFALAALAACSDTPSSPATQQQLIPQALNSASVDQVVPGEVLVKFRDGEAGTLAARKYVSGIRRSGYRHSFEVLAAQPGQERALAAELAQDPAVEWAEPNYIRHVDAIDSRLWAFFNPGGLNMSFYNDPNGATGTIPASYASTLDADEDAIAGIAANGGDVVVGTIDTGVDFNHPEFTGRLIAGCDWYSQAAAGNGSATCSDFTPFDTPDEGHGTHTTGTMAGTNVGVAGVTGASPHVKIYVQRVCGPVGCYTSSIINAIRAAADQPNMVAMNLSLGGGTESQGEKSAISYATGKGVLVIAAAGNSGSGKVGCPACDANAISVSATTWQDALAAYSQYGSGLDISAPGGYCYSNTTEDGCIFSSVVSGYQGGRTYSGPTSGTYAYMQGTSMATPQVTGAAAAVASKTGLRGSALRTRLLSTADDKGAAGVDTKFGNGRLNVYRAVTGTSLGAGL